MNDFLKNIEKNIRSRRLFRQGQQILVAVSGGLDSMVLLSTLHELAKENKWRLTVAHLNHQLRGRSSDADERLVCRAAARLGLPFEVERADVRQAAQSKGISLEMAARQIRHDFLARAAARLTIRTIAMAHHADDQVELFFIRLLRGTGGEGLAGMKWATTSPANRKIALVRPMLDQTKSALLDFAAKQKISFREDASNSSLDIQRNRLRHELLPLIRKHFQPALAKTVLRMMDIIGAEVELVTQSAVDWLEANRPPGTATPATSQPFDQLPVALQRRCLQLQLLRHGITPNYDLVEQLRTSPDHPVARKGREADPTAVGTPLYVFRDDTGVLHLKETAPATFRGESLEVELGAGAGEATFDGTTISWHTKKLNSPKPVKRLAGTETFDAEQVGSAISLRHWRPGDRYQPIGMSSSVKLQDFFTNQKMPQARRHELIVATTSTGDIFWVEGQRISENYKVTPRTNRLLQWRWHRV